MNFRCRVRIGAALLLTAVCASFALALTAEPMAAERARELYLARAVDAWVAGDLVACERWLDQIADVGGNDVTVRGEALRAASAGLRGEGGRVARLVGETEYGRGTVDGPAATDSSLGPSLRFALRRLGAESLDQGDWLGAERAYRHADSLRTAAAAVLLLARTDAGADSLWRLWSGAHAGALADPDVRWIDARDLLGELVERAESASQLRDSFDRREFAPRRREINGVAHPLLSEGPAPSPAEFARVAAAGDSLAIAAHDRSEAATDLEELEASRARLARYLALGRARLADERAHAAALATRLDSLCAQALAAAERLESQRAGTTARLAQRVLRMRERASDHTVAYDAMEHFYLEGPAWPVPAPMGHATPNAVLDADRALAAEHARQAADAGLRAEALTRANFVDQFGPRIEARRAAMLLRLRQQDGAIASLGGQLDGHPAERALADACAAARDELGRRAERFAAQQEHLHALRVALASSWADQVAARLAAESEVDAYGLVAAAYGAAQEEATPEALAAARSVARARLERFLGDFPEAMARGESRYRLADLILADERARLHVDGTLPDLSVALGLYDALLRDDSTYAHRDAVLHQAGLLRLDSGDPGMASEGAAQLTRLLAEHSGSTFTQSAQLRLGVAHFERAEFDPDEFDRAATLFEAAANGPDRAMGAIALYELGWLRINQDRLLDAADSFRRLIDRYEDGLDAEVRFDLRQEAERDLVSCLARSGGATAFRQVFTPHGPKPYDERILVQLADLLREHALFAEAAETHALRMELGPLSPTALDAGARRIDCLDLGYRSMEAEQARLASVDQFGPGTAWASAQNADSVRTRGSLFARNQLAEVARARHADARAALDSVKTPDAGLWRASSALHERLLERWDGDRDAPRWHFLAAEARAHEAAYGAARAHFRAAAESDTAHFALQAAWQEAAITDAWYEATRGGREHGDDARADDLLQSIARFRQRAPDDPRSVDLLWRAGQVAWAHADSDAALASFQEMASRHESDPRAPEAAEHCAEILTRMGRRSEAASALEDLARRWPARAGADRALYRAALVYRDESRPVDALRVLRRLTSAHSESELSRDAWLLTAQVAESAAEPRASADAYRTLAERFPHDADAAAALLRAADLYEDVGDTGETDRMRLSYLDARPDDEETALAILEPFARRELAAGGATATSATSASKLARYLSLAERHPNLAANDLMAEVDFARGDAAAAECERIPLSQPLAASLERRRAALEAALACFRRTAEHGVPAWMHAANVRTGELLVSLGEALEASERPHELSDDDRAAYDQVLREQAWDLYDQGEQVWSELLTRTRDAKDDPGGWLARARAELWPRVASRFVHRPEVEFPVVLPVLPEVSR